MKSQLAACLKVPGCEGSGLNKLPEKRHYREGRLSKSFCAFSGCASFLLPILNLEGESLGEDTAIRKRKISKGTYSLVSRAEGGLTLAEGKLQEQRTRLSNGLANSLLC